MKFVVLLAICSAATIWVLTASTNRTHRQDAAEGPLHISGKSLDIGTVWAQRGFERAVTLQNGSDEPLQVDLSTSCNCTGISPTSFVLPAHSEQILKLELDLVGPRDDLGTPAPFAVAIMASVNRGERPAQQWQLHGRIRSGIVVEPRTLDFGETYDSDGPPAPRTIAVRCLSDLGDLAVDCDAELGTAEVTKERSKAGAFLVTVLPRAGLPVGTHKFRLRVQATSGGLEIPPVDVPMVVKVVGKYRVVPDIGHLGLVEIGQSVEHSFAVLSRDDDQAEVINAISDNQEFVPTIQHTVQGDETGVQSALVQIRCTPSEPGRRTAHIQFVVQSERKEDARVVELQLSCEALPPAQSLHVSNASRGTTLPMPGQVTPD
ncbi:MAG: hypothetical protein ACKV0T_21265 [Planctomycetales bacterium]